MKSCFEIVIALIIVVLFATGIWFLPPTREPNYNDCDEALRTRFALSNCSHSLWRFNRLASEADREAIRKVRNLTELWSLLEKKTDIDGPLAPSPKDDNYIAYMVDGWKRPYVLEIKLVNKTTIIRIASKPPGEKVLYIESIIDEEGGQIKRSWLGED